MFTRLDDEIGLHIDARRTSNDRDSFVPVKPRNADKLLSSTADTFGRHLRATALAIHLSKYPVMSPVAAVAASDRKTTHLIS